MSSLPRTDVPPATPISLEEGKIWRDRWRQASEWDRRLRAQRIQSINWERDWPWIDGLLNLGVRFAEPRLPKRMIAYRRRLEETFNR